MASARIWNFSLNDLNVCVPYAFFCLPVTVSIIAPPEKRILREKKNIYYILYFNQYIFLFDILLQYNYKSII